MLAELLGVVEADPVPDPDLRPDLDRLTGVYEHAFATLTVTAGDDPGTVVVTPSPRNVDGWQPPVTSPVTFGFSSPTDIVSLDHPAPVKVTHFDPDGDPAQWLLWEHRRAPRTGDVPGAPT